MIKVAFLGTPDFVNPIRDQIAKDFTLVHSLDNADLGVVAAYGHILTKKELATPKFGCINIHPSLLPKYRGPSPIQSAILNKDKISGISIIKMDKDIDHGPVIYQEQLELSVDDNFDILSKKMFLRAAEVLPDIINDFVSGKVKPQAQKHSLATYCKSLARKSGYFDILHPPLPEALDRMIRAYYPWPGVWSKWKMENGKWKIVKFYPEGKIQMEGKKAIPLKDFLNGYPDFPLKRFS